MFSAWISTNNDCFLARHEWLNNSQRHYFSYHKCLKNSLSSWKLQLQIQVTAHWCLLAIHSCFIASRLTISLDSLAMLPTLLLILHRHPERFCTCSMFRHAVERCLTNSAEMCYGSSAACTQGNAKHTLQREILQLVCRRCCVLGACAFALLYATTPGMADCAWCRVWVRNLVWHIKGRT